MHINILSGGAAQGLAIDRTSKHAQYNLRLHYNKNPLQMEYV